MLSFLSRLFKPKITMAAAPIRKPIVVIIGTTGAGKSKMAVDIALALDGEVINADAMQVYKGLDVLTNKMSMEEMQGVPHHLLGVREPGEEYVVGHWLKDTIDTIEQLHSRNKLPVIVGGTTYWIQHLLFSNRLISSPTSSSHPEAAQSDFTIELQSALDTLSSSQRNIFDGVGAMSSTEITTDEQMLSLYQLLAHLDPEMAARWHWRDTRKVLRNLQIIRETGKRASEIVRGQDETETQSRYPSLVLWPYTRPELLDERLDDRVDQMIQAGIIDEVKALNKIADELHASKGTAVDFQTGIFQSIGFKEFQDYLAQPPSNEATATSTLKYNQAVEEMKAGTRKYARYQVKWIRKRMAPLILQEANDLEMNVIDTSDAANWSPIGKRAVEFAQAFVKNQNVDLTALEKALHDSLFSQLPKSSVTSKPSEVLSTRKKRTCDVCTEDPTKPVMLDEEKEWELHIKSRPHMRKVTQPARDAEIKRLKEEAEERRRLKMAIAEALE